MNQVSEGEVQLSGDQFIGVQEDGAFNEWASVAPENVGAKENEKFSQWGTQPSADLDCQHRRDNGIFCITMTSVIQFTNIRPFPDFRITESETVQETQGEDAYSKELWSKLTERWEQLNLTNQDPWSTEFSKFVASVQVPFTYLLTQMRVSENLPCNLCSRRTRLPKKIRWLINRTRWRREKNVWRKRICRVLFCASKRQSNRTQSVSKGGCCWEERKPKTNR